MCFFSQLCCRLRLVEMLGLREATVSVQVTGLSQHRPKMHNVWSVAVCVAMLGQMFHTHNGSK